MFSRDFIYLGVSALQVVLAALITPILTRLVGVGEFGQLALTIVVAQLLGLKIHYHIKSGRPPPPKFSGMMASCQLTIPSRNS